MVIELNQAMTRRGEQYHSLYHHNITTTTLLGPDGNSEIYSPILLKYIYLSIQCTLTNNLSI